MTHIKVTYRLHLSYTNSAKRLDCGPQTPVTHTNTQLQSCNQK